MGTARRKKATEKEGGGMGGEVGMGPGRGSGTIMISKKRGNMLVLPPSSVGREARALAGPLFWQK